MESADPEMLLRIGKGVTVERVLDVLRWARDLGLHCMVNLMFGWPDETLEELRTTVQFIDRAAPLAARLRGRCRARAQLLPPAGRGAGADSGRVAQEGRLHLRKDLLSAPRHGLGTAAGGGDRHSRGWSALID